MIYVITRQVNDYNQHGSYFYCAFTHSPTIDEIKSALNCDDDFAKHVFNGGGRLNSEMEWYDLDVVKSGEIFK